MATKNKEYYYVLVFTVSGPVYVTDLGDHHMAYWKKGDTPMHFTKDWANEVVFGLLVNGYNAVCVVSKQDEIMQPYNYIDFDMTLVEKARGGDKE